MFRNSLNSFPWYFSIYCLSLIHISFNPPFKRADRLIMRWCYHRESEVSMDTVSYTHLDVYKRQQEYGFEYADELHEKEIGRKGL